MDPTPANQRATVTAEHGISLGEATKLWARVAMLSFGGPAGQIAVMHRIVVEERRWVSEARFLHALNYCMLLPGPEAQQLATYLGWLMHRTPGGLIAGSLFVLPGAVALMALSWLYVLGGHIPAIEGLFFGLKAAVLAVVVEAVLRVGRRALKSRFAVGVAAAAFFSLFLFAIPFPVVVIAAGFAGFLAYRAGIRVGAQVGHAAQPGSEDCDVDHLGDAAPGHARPTLARAAAVVAVWLPLWLGPVAVLWLSLGPSDTFTRLAVFFSKTAVVTFGGAYAVLAYVAQQAVQTFGWLQPGEMLAGLGMAETTPGPLIMVVQYVGFLAGYRDPDGLAPLLAGTLAGLLVTWVTFTPCFLWVFLGAPFVEQLRGARSLNAALSAVTAAVVGVILNLAVWFAIHVVFREVALLRLGPVSVDIPILASLDPFATIIAIGAGLALFKFKIGVMRTLTAASMAGVVIGVLAASRAP